VHVKGRQIALAESCTSPIRLDLEGCKAQDDVSRPFAIEYGHGHWVGPWLEVLVGTLNHNRGLRADPLYIWKNRKA